MACAIAAGDAFTLRAGCDKQFATCRAKFANAVNFRGFPHMPGDDFVLSYATQGDPDNDRREPAVDDRDSRHDIVAAARGWLGTPYRDQASLKGVGCDCLGLVRGVWREVLGDEPSAAAAL